MSGAERQKATVFVGGLDNAINASILHSAFVPFGEIVDISLPKPELKSNSDSHRGFGYVEFEAAADAREAIDNMDQSELYGRIIKVAAAKPQKDREEGLGSKTAVWEQEGYLAKHVVHEEDRAEVQVSSMDDEVAAIDPMQGLEELDVAGPKTQ